MTISELKKLGHGRWTGSMKRTIVQQWHGGGWTKVYGCNDTGGESFSTKINSKQKHIVLVKMFNKQWVQICEKQIEYVPQVINWKKIGFFC